MTYREKIQAMKRMQMELYDIAEGMRDAATLEEKEAWNKFRGQSREAFLTLGRLDNSLNQNRANTQGFTDLISIKA